MCHIKLIILIDTIAAIVQNYYCKFQARMTLQLVNWLKFMFDVEFKFENAIKWQKIINIWVVKGR